MALLDVFRSDATIRKRNAHKYTVDIQRSRDIFQRYLKSCRQKRELIDSIYMLTLRSNLTGRSNQADLEAATPVVVEATRSKRKELLAIFDPELVDIAEDERLTAEEEALVEKIHRGHIFTFSKSFKKSGHTLEDVMMLFHSLAAVIHKELVVARALETNIKGIFELRLLVEQESKFYWALPLDTHDMFDAMLHAAKEDELAASLEEKMTKAQKKMERAIAREIAREDGTGKLRVKDLCLEVYSLILEQVGCPWSGWEEAEPGLKRIKEIVYSPRLLLPIIERAVADPKQRGQVFRMLPKAYTKGDFDEIDLYT